jgi:hypothetical protein
MRKAIFLPNGQQWIGFDENHISIAASIENRGPSLGKGCVFEGCAYVAKCVVQPGEKSFGRHVTSFKLIGAKK